MSNRSFRDAGERLPVPVPAHGRRDDPQDCGHEADAGSGDENGGSGNTIAAGEELVLKMSAPVPEGVKTELYPVVN